MLLKCAGCPQCGWEWVVVVGAFIAQLLSDGISYGFGILYVNLMDTFHGTSALISSIGSLSFGSFCFIGPVAGALTNKFGFRFVAILGAFLEALGVFLSAFTPNLEFLYFSVGILIGAGGGMMYIASFVCVSEYFDSKRPLATSIASCGSSAGTFLFGFLYRICIDYYGWRGALIVFTGLMLNGVVCGSLYRPIIDPSKDPSNDDVFLENDLPLEEKKCPDGNENDVNAMDKVGNNYKMYDISESEKGTCKISVEESTYKNDTEKKPSERTIDPRLLYGSKTETEKSNTNDPMENALQKINNDILTNGKKDSSQVKRHSVVSFNLNVDDKSEPVTFAMQRRKYDIQTNVTVEKRPSVVSFDSTTVDKCNIRKHSTQTETHNIKTNGSIDVSLVESPSIVSFNLPMPGNSAKTVATANNSSKAGRPLYCRQISRQSLSSIRSRTMSVATLTLGTTNVKLFKDWRFILYTLSTFLYCFGYGIPFVLLPDMAESNGFSSNEAAWIISEFGITAIVGKIVFGFLSQLFTTKDGHANTRLNTIGVTLSGIAIACAPWASSFSVLLVIGGAFGFMSAAVNTLVTLVLIELLGEERLADAFGWLNFFGGVGYISGPVVAGWLFDITNAYVATFIAAGGSLVLSGVVIFPIIVNSSRRRNDLETTTQIDRRRRSSVCSSVRPSVGL